MSDSLLYAFQIMGLGMAGILVVMAVIWGAIALLGKIFKEKKES